TRAVHTVISAQCTGCGLCLSPCPTECIQLIPVRNSTANWKWDLHTIPVQILEVERHV
ncbi:4Fe-4S binding protein, partial [Edwardsiella tarda]